MAGNHISGSLFSRRLFITSGLATVAVASAPVKAFAQPQPAGSEDNIVLRGGSVLRLDGSAAATADIHVRGGEIVSIGEALDVEGARIIDLGGCIVMPGLVDTHWHMWNSLARGFSMSSLGPFAKTMAPLARAWTPAASALSVKLAAAEAINAGITTANNWAHNTKSIEFAQAEFNAMVESGLRGRLSYGYPQALGSDERMNFKAFENFLRDSKATSSLIDIGICTRGPDRSAGNIWREEWEFARQNNLPITTHIASDRQAGAMGNIATMAKEKLLGPDVQLVHATHATRADFDLIREAQSPVSISPWTELEVGYGIPPIALMAETQVTLGLSVDNMVLSGNADMFSVMKVTADIAAGQMEEQGVVDDATVLRWATAEGAKSLGYGEKIGVLKPGMRADIIAVRHDALNTVAAMSSEFLLTHSAQPQNVDFVMIDGLVHKQSGELINIEVSALVEEADRMMADLREQAGL